MTTRRLIAIDQIFKPIYWLMVSIKSWLPARKKSVDTFLVMKFFGLGSITRIVTVIEQLDIPKEKIHLLTLRKNKEILDFLGIQGIYIDNHNFLVLFSSAFKVIFTVWKTKNAQVLDLERSSNMAGIFRVVIAIRKPCSSYHFKKTNTIKGNQVFISLFQKPAIRAIAEMFNKKLPDPSDNEIKSKTESPYKIYVNINAGDYLRERMFPIARFKALILALYQARPESEFVLTGGNREMKRVADFKQALLDADIPEKKLHNLSGQLTISEMANELLSGTLFITNDSGPLHLAQYLKTKTVCIWGPTSAELVGYPASGLMLNLVPNENCHPCFLHPKSNVAKACNGELTCFKSMEIEQMKNEILRFAEHGN